MDAVIAAPDEVTRAKAESAAEAVVAKAHHGATGLTVTDEGTWLYDDDLVAGPELGETSVFRFSVTNGSTIRETVLAHAASGRVLMHINEIAHANRRICDNAGCQPIDEPVVAGAPAAYFSTLPIKAIVRDLRAAGVPASVSNSAGTFVCNHLFFGLMHRLATRGPAGLRGGFIHIPFLPEQAARWPGQPSMALAAVVDALRIAVSTSLVVHQDLRETGGALR